MFRLNDSLSVIILRYMTWHLRRSAIKCIEFCKSSDYGHFIPQNCVDKGAAPICKNVVSIDYCDQ